MRKRGSSRTRLLVTSKQRQDGERGGVEDPNAEPDKEYVYTIEHEVNVVNLSQSGCGVNKIEKRKTATRGLGPKNP